MLLRSSVRRCRFPRATNLTPFPTDVGCPSGADGTDSIQTASRNPSPNAWRPPARHRLARGLGDDEPVMERRAVVVIRPDGRRERVVTEPESRARHPGRASHRSHAQAPDTRRFWRRWSENELRPSSLMEPMIRRSSHRRASAAGPSSGAGRSNGSTTAYRTCSKDENEQVSAEAARVLVPGGRVALKVVNGMYFPADMRGRYPPHAFVQADVSTW